MNNLRNLSITLCLFVLITITSCSKSTENVEPATNTLVGTTWTRQETKETNGVTVTTTTNVIFDKAASGYVEVKSSNTEITSKNVNFTYTYANGKGTFKPVDTTQESDTFTITDNSLAFSKASDKPLTKK